METLAGCSPVLLISLVGKKRVEGDSGEAAAANCFSQFQTDGADHTRRLGLVQLPPIRTLHQKKDH